jgi:hypothetical protein
MACPWVMRLGDPIERSLSCPRVVLHSQIDRCPLQCSLAAVIAMALQIEHSYGTHPSFTVSQIHITPLPPLWPRRHFLAANASSSFLTYISILCTFACKFYHPSAKALPFLARLSRTNMSSVNISLLTRYSLST